MYFKQKKIFSIFGRNTRQNTTQKMHQSLQRSNKFVEKKPGKIEHKLIDLAISVRPLLMVLTLFVLVAKGVFSREVSK